MNVPSIAFLAFAVAGAVVFNLSRSDGWRRLVLLALNIGFFCTFITSVGAAAPYIIFLAVGFIGLQLILRRASTPVFVIFFLIVLLGFFELKRYVFIPPPLFLKFKYTTIGLSYVFFRVLHLLIDAWQEALPDKPSLLSYVNYTLNFPALVSGPIQSYPDYRRAERDTNAILDIFVLARSVERMIIGFFKVAVVSMLLMKIQQSSIDDLNLSGSFGIKALDCAVIGGIYPLFLYANFSGYTDFVIGVARLYRIPLPENFDNPFLAENMIIFWSRWHMTLSNWLKTYVYTPLLMTLMRRFPFGAAEPYFGVFAYFVTFFLVGAWHGQTTMFMFFGVLQGGGTAANKLYQILLTRRLTRKGYRALAANRLYADISRGLNFTWFAFTLLWFWSSWSQLGALLTEAGPWAAVAGWAVVLATSTVVLSICAALHRRFVRASSPEAAALSPSRYWRTIAGTAMVVIIVAFTVILNGPAPDVVYKNF